MVLVVFIGVADYKKLFYLLLVCIPLSTEIALPNGFGTELPTEPLMIGLMLIAVSVSVRHGHHFGGDFLRHPLSLLVLMHLSWILVTAIYSQDFIVSIKFFLAKVWYIVVFYFLAARILVSEKQVRLMIWSVLIPLLFTIFVILIRHSAYNFSFQDVRWVLHPFYRNHVAYASIMALFLPFVWFSRKWYRSGSSKWIFLIFSVAVLLIAIQLSYTRVAYLSLMVAAGLYFIIRFRMMRIVLFSSLLTATIALLWLVNNNRYLDFAPNYEKTISHEQFDNLVEATYKLEDISTMERLYRWVAGFNMVGERTMLGFGPGNFYNFYRSYTVSSFQTYVSDNPEKSGIHSYYLMIAVEQGMVGLFIFLGMSFYVLLLSEKAYHESTSKSQRAIVLMGALSLVVIDTILLINDMIETDKVGPFFFLSMAIIVNADLRNKKQRLDKLNRI